MAKSTKTTKTAAKTTKPAAEKAKTTKPAAKKPTTKTASKATAAPKTTAAPKSKAAPKSNGKAATKAPAMDPADKLAKSCQEAAAKFEKLEAEKYTEIKEKLEWCLGSYGHDKNPSGLKEYGEKAVGLLKEAKKDKPRLISQKLIDDLEKSLAKV